MKSFLFVLFSSFILNAKAEPSLIRRTQYGLIRGTLTHSELNPTVEYYSFKGVPYARPPIGDLRFNEALPSSSWSGIRETNESASICVQISDDFMGDDVVGNEDCLYLEIFEPNTARLGRTAPMPVLVWFHGGTFIFTVINNGVDYFMEKPVVIVVVEYRLNVFGFLSTKNDHAKGNYGLKDQVLALQWVRENIENFGGDANSVTIFGSSAGGASVQYHMLSSKSQGLFHRAISQGGSALDRWALQEKPMEMTRKLAKGLGITTTDNKLLIEELRRIDYRVIMKAAFNQSIVGFYTPYYAQPFAPSIESESKSAFLSESAFVLLQEGNIRNKVPYITGYNTEEGSFAYYFLMHKRDIVIDINNSRIDMNIYESNPELLIPISLNITSNGSPCHKEVLNQIVAVYFKNGPVTDKKNWINYMSQDLFVRGIIKSMDLMFKHVPLYLYRFSYSGTTSISFVGGVGHHEELQYIWKEPPSMSEADMLTSKRMITMWTNFARMGNPTPESDELLQNIIWPKIDSHKAFLDFGRNLTILDNPEQVHYEFWENLFETCGNPPFNTY